MNPVISSRQYHLIGIGGVGMSALAQALRDRGDRVSGSDRALDTGGSTAPPIFSVLRAAGIQLFPQDGSGIHAGLHAVITSTAVEPGNPDLEAAARANIPVRHRAECLAELVDGRRLIAVAGTAGKTTVTAMIGWIMEQVGGDPTVI
ncbi:Mur ligase domain-containing protein, partial [Thermosphaera sp.]